ncbi:tetratricopeptide repeat protein [uncultured Gimesia sp.]|uniref:tetratricopeptide repeat protein n=1 Tax=uncultured Gimesia sp. TaxID=1678688 RepID=UPI00260DE675|nr:tetratricopeptide repeat protein [uncultured Gimesia sp.]
MRLWIHRVLLGWLILTTSLGEVTQAEEPTSKAASAQEQALLKGKLEKQIAELTAQVKQNPDEISLYSRRGDANFFLGNFEAAVADYDKMLKLKPSIKASHWRRGIACYYARQYSEAAKQFESYHSFDNIDRENGIWRFFSQYRANGEKAARQGLLKYEKDDREPFPDIYRLFEEKITPEKILNNIQSAEISKEERSKRQFYAYLYIGLNESLHGRKADARLYLQKAVDNKWGPHAGFGPNYMWHTGRLELELLTKPQTKK